MFANSMERFSRSRERRCSRDFAISECRSRRQGLTLAATRFADSSVLAATVERAVAVDVDRPKAAR